MKSYMLLSNVFFDIFQVTSVWNTSIGILIERDLGQVSIDMTGKSLPLPTLYSLSQPLKEVLPLFLLKQGQVIINIKTACIKLVIFFFRL